MKKKIYLLGLILAIIILIGGATLLYNRLQDDIASNQLVTFEEPQNKSAETPAQPDNTDEEHLNTPDIQPEKNDGEKPTEKPEPTPVQGKQTAKPAPSATPSLAPSEKLVSNPTAEPQKNNADKEETTKSKEKDTQSGKPLAPDCTIYDKNGKAVMLSSLLGKPTVLNFWASWCGPCLSEMPDFERKYQEIGNEVNFLMVNMTDGTRETFAQASGFIKEVGYTFPVYYDKSSSAANTYRVYSIPTTYFIDADGYIIAQASGAIDHSTLQRGIDMIN